METVLLNILKTKVCDFFDDYYDVFQILKRLGITLGCVLVLFGPCFYLAILERRGEFPGMGNFVGTWLGCSILLDLSLAVILGFAFLAFMGIKALIMWIITGN